MPTVTTNLYRTKSAAQEVSLSGDSWAVALMNAHVSSASEATLKQTNYWSEVSGFEVSGGTYSAMPLSAETLSANISDVVFWDGENITWNDVTVSPYGLTIYRISDGLLVGFVEFSSQAVAINGSITLAWNSAGIMNIF
jgi:hypothetical protein